MSGGSVAGNTTSLDGGGINNFGGAVSLTVDVTNNTARAGGGLSSGNGVLDGKLFVATVTIEGGSVSGNTATTFSGGGINSLAAS